jgi:copper chaperone
MPTLTISVPEIHCDHCKHSIEGALAPLPGVRSATVDVDARTVTVQVDDRGADRSRIVAAIEDQGYEVPAPGA